MRLSNKTAFITGGNSGIGLATAKLFLAEGAKVAITGRNEKTLKEAQESLGEDAIVIRADINDVAQLDRAFKEASAKLGKIDIVFANAGVGGATPLGDTTLATFEEIVRSNFTSAFFTVQSALPYLRDGGSVILNGSVHAVLGAPGMSAYAGAKGAVRSMIRNLASELAPRRIRVNQVTPGGTKTPIWNSRAPTPEAFDALESWIKRGTPLNRMGEAEDIAKAALYLASDDSIHVTATEIVVDGGATSAPYGAPIHKG